MAVDWEGVLMWGYVMCQMLAPIPYLVWVWRCTGSWRRLAVGVFVIVPSVSFLVGGFLGMLVFAFRAYVMDIGPTADDHGRGVGVYFCSLYGMFGCTGIMLNFIGLFLSTPLFAVWRLVHRKSLARVVGHRA